MIDNKFNVGKAHWSQPNVCFSTPKKTASDLAEYRLHGTVAVDQALLFRLLQILLLDVHPSGRATSRGYGAPFHFKLLLQSHYSSQLCRDHGLLTAYGHALTREQQKQPSRRGDNTVAVQYNSKGPRARKPRRKLRLTFFGTVETKKKKIVLSGECFN